MSAEYNFTTIEEKWKKKWNVNQLYRVENTSNKPKCYVLDMFPYPSGKGLHVGHPLGYVASDIYARFKRLKGFHVLHPMGYDAFGLPAEQFAIETGQHPAVTTEQSIAMFRSQLDKIGFSFDWSRQVKTCDSSYYKWTQWIFIQLFNSWYNKKEKKAQSIAELEAYFAKNGMNELQFYFKEGIENFSSEQWRNYSELKKQQILLNYRLAYQDFAEVNWCEALGTVLANDEVKDGKSERGGHPVERKKMRQWFLRITDFADRLLEGLETLDWSAAMKDMQRNWIGKSEGAEIQLPLAYAVDGVQYIPVFTTRPDTIFGVSFVVVAPEHDLVPLLTTEGQKEEVQNYLSYVKSRSDVERQQEKSVTGVFTGSFVKHPFLEKNVPVWISEYVLTGYGTGAIMGVPADDERDLRFAQKFGLEILPIVDKSMYPDAGMEDKVGKMVNSGFINGMEVLQAIQAVIEKLEELGIGKRRVNFRLRDAGFSRQRYWGEPIPVVYKKLDGVEIPYTLNESDLPLVLPEVNSYKPTGDGKAPLANNVEWMNTAEGVRETDTMPGYAGSSWYFLRYMDPEFESGIASDSAINFWKNVDLYIGGSEHAVGHLLYARFWQKFLFDIGIAATDEPFQRLVNQGMIGGRSSIVYRIDGENKFVSLNLKDQFKTTPIHVDIKMVYNDELDIDAFRNWREEFKEAEFVTENGKYICGYAFEKMSKRYHNVTNPDDVVANYGADCLRLYLMFLGPLEMGKPWDPKSIDGVAKFLRKVWRLFYDDNGVWKVSDCEPQKESLKVLHKTIQKIQDDIERLSVNTAVSAMMIAVNEFTSHSCKSKEVLGEFLKLLAPFAPFISEELYEALGYKESIHTSVFPEFKEEYVKENSFLYPVSVNGKTRADIEFSLEASQDEIQAVVLAHENIQKWMEGKPIKKLVFVKGRIINIVC